MTRPYKRSLRQRYFASQTQLDDDDAAAADNDECTVATNSTEQRVNTFLRPAQLSQLSPRPCEIDHTFPYLGHFLTLSCPIFAAAVLCAVCVTTLLMLFCSFISRCSLRDIALRMRQTSTWLRLHLHAQYSHFHNFTFLNTAYHC